jgi:hypothetical protein
MKYFVEDMKFLRTLFNSSMMYEKHFQILNNELMTKSWFHSAIVFPIGGIAVISGGNSGRNGGGV